MSSGDQNADQGAISLSARITTAVDTWTRQLIDVGGRNNLLYYRDLKAATLDLAKAREPTIETLLLGRPVRISNLFPQLEPRMDALHRVRTIHRKAREHFEEKGISTMYLACGIATWKNPRTATTPASPILLRPAEFRPAGAAQDDFEFALTGEMEVNPILLQVLGTDFGREIPQDALLERLDGVIDTPWELDETYRWIANEARSVPGFNVDRRMVVGNFLYAKLPMVKDLKGAHAALARHDLIAAIAGDSEARKRIRTKHAAVAVQSSEPDSIDPADEYLVLDADSSQNMAINRVLRGQDLIIKGPPGTGKSQTIANLIASLLARGKTVLFVAEKRAAIDAVFRRLDRAGLSDMLLDVHSGAGSRRQVAENLNKALTAMGSTASVGADASYAKLVKSRKRLIEHVDAMHAAREPWGVSFLQAIEGALRLPDRSRSTVRLTGQVLDNLSEEAINGLRHDLRDYVDLRGGELEQSPWAQAPLDSSEAVRDIYDRLQNLRRLFTRSDDTLWPALAESRLEPADLPSDIEARLSVWSSIASLGEVLKLDVFATELDRLTLNMRPVRHPLSKVWATITSSLFRDTRKEARSFLVDSKTSDLDVLSALNLARDVLQQWRAQGSEAPPNVPVNLAELVEGESALGTELRSCAEQIGGANLADMARSLARAHVDDLIADRSTIQRLPEIRRTRKALLNAGLGELLEFVVRSDLDLDESEAALQWSWLMSLVDRLEFVDPALGSFDPDRMRAIAAEYAELDRSHIAKTARRIRRLYAEHGIVQRDAYPDEAALIKRQAALKRRHLPLRELFRLAPHALLGVKPCWAMSPLVVSQILPSDRPYFDVVVFDEASQIIPADAIPAVMRGKGLVIAGDDKQLPPTSFFMATQPEDEQVEEEQLELDLTKGFESVLDSLAALLPTTRLDWHYRSQDERLIAFSNEAFYDGQLVTFPGVAGRGSIKHVLVGPDATVESAASSSREVEAVVRLVIEHARAHPEESLGVIAMGITHATRIEDALLLALRNHPELDDFFDERRDERFFVKNLERVQGDERDAIILSVGYGKSPDARLFYRFGPLNLEGGERRLNVAITRARLRMTVISSFSAGEMDPARTVRRGPQLLRAYLAYAEGAGTAPEGKTQDATDSDLADHVRTALEVRGLQATARVGASSQWIDVAVNDPDDPSRYVLAVELDAGRYRSIPTTRDRERLRREQLARLGWQHHRLWSFEWLKDSATALDLIVDRAHGAAHGEAVHAATMPAAPELLATEDAAGSRGPRPNLGYYSKIDDIQFTRLVALIDWIESDGLLRTEDEVMRTAQAELQFQRMGNRIEAALRGAIEFARRRRTK